ncbi:MAG: PEP-CTERM sorting domain-containing protein [Chthoniobacterales bacterium]
MKISTEKYILSLCMAVIGLFLAAGTVSAQIYVSQNGATNGSVLIFGLSGGSTPTGTLASGATGGLSTNTYGLSLDAAGNVYVADFSHQAVREYTSGGTQIGNPLINGGGSNTAFQAAVTSTNIYVAYYATGVVTKYNSSPTPGTGVNVVMGLGASSADGLALDPTGTFLYVLDRANAVTGAANVGRLNIATGVYTGGFISGLTKVSGITTDPAGNIYVATDGGVGNTDVITVFPSTGGTITAGTLFRGGLNDPYGMSVFDGYLYVANSGTKSVGKFLLSDGTVGSTTFISGLAQLDFGLVVIPEPSSVALLCIGGMAFACFKTRRMLRKKAV